MDDHGSPIRCGSLSDPDPRSMATTPRMPRVVVYNVQTAVEAENHLIEVVAGFRTSS